MFLLCDELILSQNFDIVQSDGMTPDGPISNVFLNYFHVYWGPRYNLQWSQKNHPTPMLYIIYSKTYTCTYANRYICQFIFIQYTCIISILISIFSEDIPHNMMHEIYSMLSARGCQVDSKSNVLLQLNWWHKSYAWMDMCHSIMCCSVMYLTVSDHHALKSVIGYIADMAHSGCAASKSRDLPMCVCFLYHGNWTTF